MDITVTVVCTDQTIKIKYAELLKFDYFKTLLSTNFNCKMTHSTETITDFKGQTRILDCYKIPQLTVDCKASTLQKLVYPHKVLFLTETNPNAGKYKSFFHRKAHSRYEVEFIVEPLDEYTDDLVELFLYNDMYGFSHSISLGNKSHMIEEYFGLITFIKQKLPHLNPYDVIQCHTHGPVFVDMSFSLCPQGKLDESLIPDLLEYIDYGLWGYSEIHTG